MMSRAFRVAAGSVLALSASTAAVQARDLSFADRVRAQEALERVYYFYQSGTRKPFEEAVPRDLLERKVVKYLKQSVALEQYWHTPVTAEMLQRELQRMSRGTRMPDRLRELLASLNDDPVLILECLARATLVGRLTRNFFAYDARFQASARREADALHKALATGSLDPWQEHPSRTDAVLSRESRDGRPVTDSQFDRWRSHLPGAAGDVHPVEEDREAFLVRVLLDADDTHLRLATYRVEKTSWDSWWGTVSPELDEGTVVNVTTNDASVPGELGSPDRGWDPQSWRRRGVDDPCDDYDVWDNGTMDDIPDPTSDHSAVWTGSIMVIWGLNSHGGWRYDPATDTWTAASTENAPARSSNHTAVWTGSLMLVWGGDFRGELNTGGRYDPATDTWTAISIVGAPSPRQKHTAVWTGDLMLVWGGYDYVHNGGDTYFQDGGRYDPATDTWTAISIVGAPSPRQEHTAVWTGSLMLVWGGRHIYTELNTGGRYDPATDTWMEITTTGAGLGRTLHTAVWTGNLMVIWGGFRTGEGSLNTGLRYDPATDAWATTSLLLAPTGRSGHTAVWTGNLMLVWSGSSGAGGQYDPATDSWEAIPTTGEPSPRHDHTAVWTGSLMLVWGGRAGSGSLNTGGRYDPATRTWTAIATTNAPSPRYGHTAVWTGSLMLIWGGSQNSLLQLDTGGRYDPATDSWTTISTAGAPGRRGWHTAVWTGNLMLVWGGVEHDSEYDTEFGDGGRYDPASDTWTDITTAGAPDNRFSHTAVWTGNLMLVWGGGDAYDGPMNMDTGGRYDPASDSWTNITTTGAPSNRWVHTAVWTGSLMLVWGGQDYGGGLHGLDTGGRYDPATDTWTAISNSGAPSPRREHTAVWTGNLMLVWGGIGPDYRVDTGGRYDPATDTWMATSTVDAPTPRSLHTAVWTGTRMVIWGGFYDYPATNTGGRYDPATDTWLATSTAGAPLGRFRHSAVWTGSLMLVWGGKELSTPWTSGGRYALGHSSDDDGDGHTVCDGDCNEGNPTIYPGAPETNDGVDNQCPEDEGHGLIDEIEVDSGFYNPLDLTEYSWSAQPGATLYEVARFLEPDSPANCTLTPTADTHVSDSQTPMSGGVFHYLVRAFAPHVGSWGRNSAGVERSDVCP